MKKIIISLVILVIGAVIGININTLSDINVQAAEEEPNDIEQTIITMTQEVINENNYYLLGDFQPYVGEEVKYNISFKDNTYIISIYSENEDISSDYTFMFDGINNVYLVDNEPIADTELVYSGTFHVDDVYIPNYDECSAINDEYLKAIAQNIADCQLEQSECTSVTVTILNNFEWDRSNMGYIPILVNYGNEEFIITTAYFSGGEWLIENANYLLDYNENEEYVEKCLKCKVADAYSFN